jgi:hypothetical protein
LLAIVYTFVYTPDMIDMEIKSDKQILAFLKSYYLRTPKLTLPLLASIIGISRSTLINAFAAKTATSEVMTKIRKFIGLL